MAALGLFFFGFGVYSIALGYGLGHAGGWSMVATGLICAGIGIPAVRKGRKIYDAIAS